MTISTTDQISQGVFFATRRLAPPLVGMTAFGLLLALIVHLVVLWQGGGIGAATGDGAEGWLGVVVTGDQVQVSGLAWLGVAAAGLTALVLAASIPGLVIGPLVSTGVTRLAAAVTSVLAILGMLAVVVLTLVLTATVTSGSLLAAAPALATGKRGLTTLAVLMFLVLCLATASSHGPVAGRIAFFVVVVLIPVSASILGWWPPPVVMATVVPLGAIVGFVALTLRLPVR